MSEPVFPIRGADGTLYDLHYLNATAGKYASGLTKRELFAAMAMQGMLANAYLRADGGYANNFSPESHAKHAVLCADALIAELNSSEGHAP